MRAASTNGRARPIIPRDMMSRWSADRLVGEIARLGARGLALDRYLSVASRQEPVARVFVDEYLPNIAGSTPLTSTGSFAHA